MIKTFYELMNKKSNIWKILESLPKFWDYKSF